MRRKRIGTVLNHRQLITQIMDELRDGKISEIDF